MTIFKNFYHFKNFWSFYKFLSILKIFDYFLQFLAIFTIFGQFKNLFTIFKSFGHFYNFWPFKKILTNLGFCFGRGFVLFGDGFGDESLNESLFDPTSGPADLRVFILKNFIFQKTIFFSKTFHRFLYWQGRNFSWGRFFDSSISRYFFKISRIKCVFFESSDTMVNPYAPSVFLNFEIFSILDFTSAIINFPPDFKIRFDSEINSPTSVAIRERQNTARSTQPSSNGVFRISQGITLKFLILLEKSWDFLEKNCDFGEKLRFLEKIEISKKIWDFWRKIEILKKN